MNYTYMVKCADGTLYTGWTNCVEEAMRREYAIKQLTRKEKLKLMEFWTETSAD